MPIVVQAPPPLPPELTPELVAAVMAAQKAHCAPSTWDKFVRSLAANKFPYPTA